MTLAAILERRRVGYPRADLSPLSPVPETTRGQPKAPPLLVVPTVPTVPTTNDQVAGERRQLLGIIRAVVRFQLGDCEPNTWCTAIGAKSRAEIVAEIHRKWPHAIVLPEPALMRSDREQHRA